VLVSVSGLVANNYSKLMVIEDLAEAEMFLALAATATYDMKLFETGPEEIEYYRDQQVSQPKEKGKGVRAFVIGKAKSSI